MIKPLHIHAEMDRLGLSARNRSLHIQFSDPGLNLQLFLQRIDAGHALNAGLKAELLCLSINAHIELKQLIGCRVAVDTVTDLGQLHRISGIITGAEAGQSDGALSIYRLQLQDATALWEKRRNSRVFMNKSVPQVVEILFREWQQRSPLFAASLQLDTRGLREDYDIRPFIMQSMESDAAFIQRLLISESINSLIDESDPVPADVTSPIQPQLLRLIDDNRHYRALKRGSIRYHRSDATEARDSIDSFSAQRSLQPTAVHIQRWQAEGLYRQDGSGSVSSLHQHSSQHSVARLGLEDARQDSPAWTADLNGDDGATRAGNSQPERLNLHLSRLHELRAKQFTAEGSVRDARVGYWFELEHHPELQRHERSERELLITAKSHWHENNLPRALQQQLNRLLGDSSAHNNHHNSDRHQRSRLKLIRRQIPMVPDYDARQQPMAHPQRARVVGPKSEELHTDQWGRIKVRFLFTREDDHAHDGGAGTRDNDSDSAWVDVLTPWAGDGYGARFLPRVDEIVVIQFFDGNVDRPYVAGRLHEGHRSPTRFDGLGQLPDTKKLSGIRTREVDGTDWNQLRFDDTRDQVSAQLQSSHASSQLNLGNLSHPKDTLQDGTDRSPGRGEGFELRTDRWGALRAGEGLLLSTHARRRAEGSHLDAAEARQQLQSGLESATALSESAESQQMDPLPALAMLNELLGCIAELKVEDPAQAEAFKARIMLLASGQSTALSSSQDIHLSADTQISQTAGDSINLSTQKDLTAQAQNKISLYAAQSDLSAVAAGGKVDIRAHSNGIDLISRNDMQIDSTEEHIDFSAAHEISIKSLNSEVIINGSGIYLITKGKCTIYAAQHKFESGEKVVSPAIILPMLIPYEESQQFKIVDENNNPKENIDYLILDENSQFHIGKTDKDGLTKRVFYAKKSVLQIFYAAEAIEKMEQLGLS
ncbi:type VI secretion system Vgr family protein [Acinetobacter sp. WZC-1]|uniref:type VI secretion system Vgr family protein n=1 Tax=Acinetobacter sp. WZC-1 TaxID=3459034 RepID=UPI00403D55CC